YQRNGCRITLIKLDAMSWMNRICDDFSPGLNIQEDDDHNTPTLAPSILSQPKLKKRPAPLPPFNIVHSDLFPSISKKGSAPPLPFNAVPSASSPSSHSIPKTRPAPQPPFNLALLAPSLSSQPTIKKASALSPSTK
ncbi:unnamed protein product, partial [Rotaria sp. Silwood1]